MGMSKQEKEDLGFRLFPEDQEDQIPQRLDKSLILLRQVDRINRLAAIGDTNAYINSVQQLYYFIVHLEDKRFKADLDFEEKVYNKERAKYGPEEQFEALKMDIIFYGTKYRLLVDLMRRRGLL